MSEILLTKRTIAIPESRQLNILADMLEKRGATVLRCPLVSILDAPNAEPINGWLQACIAQPYDDFIVLTGEGIRRLCGFAERAGILSDFTQALASMRILARGPKPGQALKALGLKPTMIAEQPTTDGVISSLAQLDLSQRRVAVQLYGEDPNTKLIDYLQQRGVQATTVAPYVYASDSDDQQVIKLIEQLAAGNIDAITFTSQPQYKRMRKVAEKNDLQTQLAQGLAGTMVAAVGPVVADVLQAAGVRVDLMPESAYFMKPMVTALAKAFAEKTAAS